MAPKRKSNSKVAKPAPKKSKSDTSLWTLDHIKQVSQDVIEKSSYNDIVKLIDQYSYIKSALIQTEDSSVESIGRQLTINMYQIFQHLFQAGLLRPSKKFDDKKMILVKWLVDKYDRFKKIMYQFLSTSLSFKSSLQLDILDVSLNVLRLENQYLKSSKDDLYFPTSTYKAIVKSLVCSEVGTVLSDNTIDDFIMLEFQEKLHKYYDLQFYFFQCLNELVEQDEIPDQNRLFSIFYTLVKIPLAFEENPKELRAIKTFISKPPTTIFKPSHFKKAFQTLVISILSFKLTSSQYKCILLILNKRILPYLAQPSRLMDFLTDSYDTSDLIIQILALNSLYELMKQYNLEYPDFYTKLYSLLTPELLFNRYRSRFFRLSDLFLSSTHLSSNLVASFIKKLARLSITGPAPGVVIIIPFIYNLFKRHPSCMIMIQNPSQDPDTYEDPYDNNELDPLKTNAINSSLWELEALMNHYHPNISTLAKIFTEPFRKPNYNLEDFLDWSFKSLIESEINRKYRSMAALEFDSFDQLFDHVTGTSEGSEPESKTTVYLEGWTI